jgi:hypothetical protein
MDLETVATVGAWIWKEFGKDFLNWSKNILRRKYFDTVDQSQIEKNPIKRIIQKRNRRKILQKRFTEELKAIEMRWIDFNWGQAAERYKNHVNEIYGHIRVIGTTEPIPLGDIFTDVFILEVIETFQN